MSNISGSTFSRLFEFPSVEVKSAAWLDGLLYLGFDGCFGCVDPKLHSFRILTSTRALVPRTVLDGGARYLLAGIISDPSRHCVWFTVVDNNNPHVEEERQGLWKYEPNPDRFTQARQGGDFGVLQWTGKKILYSGFAPSIFDPETGQVQKLTGYNKWTAWLNSDELSCAMFQRDFLFKGSGYLCTADGMRADMPRRNPRFDIVECDKVGFVVGDSRTGKLYTICPVGPTTRE